jgi:hypothetical protein
LPRSLVEAGTLPSELCLLTYQTTEETTLLRGFLAGAHAKFTIPHPHEASLCSHLDPENRTTTTCTTLAVALIPKKFILPPLYS